MRRNLGFIRSTMGLLEMKESDIMSFNSANCVDIQLSRHILPPYPHQNLEVKIPQSHHSYTPQVGKKKLLNLNCPLYTMGAVDL